MGAGKTTVGKKLARLTERTFTDTDAEIEARIGKSTADIFRDEGEASFRRVESEVVARVSMLSNLVVALGGGAILAKTNWERISQTGHTVFLDWPADCLLARILHGEGRPLVEQAPLTDRADRLRRLLQERLPFYQRCTITVKCDEAMTPEQINQHILQQIEEL